ncbi:MAG TPA: ABC transporter ATP-binding protein [Candidatus Dormibacteraeota bacterium]|nr:ABC transporter ATP-binding protein [Candidatus Dormibacteraeota bacterium]
MLSLQGVTKRFGGVAALGDVTFEVAEGEILGVIGPNGAGKTTLLNCISGVYRLDAGEITFAGTPLAGLPPHRIARLGVGRTFQVVKPFASMTVRENAAVGALFGASRLPPAKAFAAADEVLELVGMAEKRWQPVATLTIPDRKRLEVARALATKPRLLLLDEVMAGLNAVEVDEALDMVRTVHRSGVTIVLIEHVMRVVIGVCERVVVLHFGQTLAEGAPADVLRDPRVIEAYLGERYAARQAQPLPSPPEGEGQGGGTLR